MKIPEKQNTVMPYLIVNNAADFMAFMKKVFGAEELHVMRRQEDPSKIQHAQVDIGGSVIMFADTVDLYPVQNAGLFIYVPDTDSTYKVAMESGCKSAMEPTKTSYSEKAAGILDPFGNTWWLAMPA